MAKHLMLIAMLAFTSCYLVCATDPSALQDFCVADFTSSERVNGHACKDPTVVQADDFFFGGLHTIPSEYNSNGFHPTPVNVEHIPGLNTLGISMGRLDFAPYGINSPHTHPRATEILLVLEGSLEVGFITSNPENHHIYKVLKAGDVFVFPVGLVHYQRNVNEEHAVALVGFSSQHPGVVSIPHAVFASVPKINSEILSKAFQIDDKVIEQMQAML